MDTSQRQIRYSAAFKRQVVEDIEAGRFSSLSAAREHYGIGGMSTISSWLRKYGRHHLLPKVVRVEKPDEADQICQLRRKVAELEKALGRTQLEKVLGEAFLEMACEEMGTEVDAFKKKSTRRGSPRPGTIRSGGKVVVCVGRNVASELLQATASSSAA